MKDKMILLVDDEKLLRWGLRVNLEKNGFRVKEAENGIHALDLMEKNHFALLLTDYLMEGMNGDQLAQQAKRKDKDLKVIMFSGYFHPGGNGSNQERERLADHFLTKPINLETLVGTIKKVLGGQ